MSKLNGASGTTRKFLEYAKPNEQGWSGIVHVDDLNAHFGTSEFTTQNGGAWCRSDTSLLAKYNVDRIKGSVVNSQGKRTTRIIAVQLKGFKESDSNSAIRGDIRKIISAQKCAVLVTASDVQVDHKCPRKELTPTVMRLDTQELTDFQALCRAANTAKRGHCQDCRDKKLRFDATILGFSVPQWQGGPVFNKTCVGCYWYDPVEFNAQVSKGYKPTPSPKL